MALDSEAVAPVEAGVEAAAGIRRLVSGRPALEFSCGCFICQAIQVLCHDAYAASYFAKRSAISLASRLL